jgi:hypothetical protein
VSQVPGWYEDLFGRDQERYWDGRLWTSYTRPVGSDDPGPFAELTKKEAKKERIKAQSLEDGVAPPKSRWRRRRAVFNVSAVVVIVAALAGAGVYVMGNHGDAAAAEAVTTAATQSLNAKSVDMSYSMSFSGMGVNMQLTGNGAFNFADQTGTLTMNVPMAAQPEQMIMFGQTVYVNVGDLGQIAPGKSWVSATASELSSGSWNSVGDGYSQFEDPAGMLQQLQANGATVTSDGATTFDGTPVTEYSVTEPSSELSQDLGSLPSSVQQAALGISIPSLTENVYVQWGNLLRAIELPFSFSVQGKTMSMDVQVSLTNYGTPVFILPPSASAVIPYTALPGIAGNTGTTGNSGSGTI